MKIFFLILAITSVAACEPTATPRDSSPVSTDLPASAADTCEARRYAHLVGKDSSALESILLLRQVRIIRTNQVVTMDFRPERINFKIDSENLIRSISCS